MSSAIDSPVNYLTISFSNFRNGQQHSIQIPFRDASETKILITRTQRYCLLFVCQLGHSHFGLNAQNFLKLFGLNAQNFRKK